MVKKAAKKPVKKVVKKQTKKPVKKKKPLKKKAPKEDEQAFVWSYSAANGEIQKTEDELGPVLGYLYINSVASGDSANTSTNTQESPQDIPSSTDKPSVWKRLLALFKRKG